jgi:hypothetical protein
VTVWYAGPGPGPATHALVIGVSAYPGRPLGLGDLPGAATSALMFARWLRDEYRPPDAPLGSVRLLLGPSRGEPAEPDVAAPTRDEVVKALNDWRADCHSSPENVAIVYLCGHGVLESTDGGVVLTQDAGRYPEADQVLADAIDIDGVRNALTGPGGPTRQWYFVDACRERDSKLDKYDGLLRGGIRFERSSVPSGAHRPVFSAALPGRQAYQSGSGSLFVRALVKCLRLDAWDPPTARDDRWRITADSLNEALTGEVGRLARQRGQSQHIAYGGEIVAGEALLTGPPPQVPVTLRVTPAAAERVQSCGAEIFDGATDARVLERRPLPVTEVPVPGGVWTLSVTFDPPHPPYRDRPAIALQVRPPMCEQPVSLS